MTSNRWIILGILFFARLAMAFQFQSIAALSPLIMDTFDVGLSDIGFLIGLYFAPGLVFALPGGAVAARFGDKRMVAIGLLLMLVGGVIIAATENWNVFVAARLIVGAGGVILNVLMTKMLVDWFVGKEISTAMAIFINSWPMGIGIALVVLPVLAANGGLLLAWIVLSILVAAALIVFVLGYRAPEDAIDAKVVLERVSFPVAALFFAGVVWALYNAALAMVFSFGPALLIQQGWSLVNAGSLISAFMIIFSIALPVGGIIADKTGRKDMIILISLISFAALMPIVVYMPATAVAILCGLGVLFALCAGPVMTLPAEVLTPKARSIGMGVFFTIYYVLMMVAPRIGGGLAEASGDAGAALIAGAIMSLMAAGALIAFRITGRT